jgi:hypothetical protein
MGIFGVLAGWGFTVSGGICSRDEIPAIYQFVNLIPQKITSLLINRFLASLEISLIKGKLEKGKWSFVGIGIEGNGDSKENLDCCEMNQWKIN